MTDTSFEMTSNDLIDRQARDAVQRLIEFRPRSVAEVVSKLQEKGFSVQVVERTVAWARSRNLLDDEAFAQLWVAHRQVQRACGAFRLRQELRKKGVDDVFVQNALDRAEIDEPQLLSELIERRLPMLAHLSHDTAQRRLVRFLIYRGFRLSEIFKVLREKGLAPH